MGTLVCFHAHPDDEALTTGGTIARATAEGHRVVLVIATNGEHGEVPDDLGPGESLVARRRTETARSAEALGVSRVEWLGYADSGMTGWDQNREPGAFMQADIETAAARLAAVLRHEAADVVTIYDWHGNYGHPDHIRVHQVGRRAAALAGTPRVLEATINRDLIVRLMSTMPMPQDDSGEEFDPTGPADDGNPMGSTEDEITLGVDVSGFLAEKRASIAAHRSQVTDTSYFLEMPEEAFAAAFGTEWFIEPGAPRHGPQMGWIFD